MDQPITFTPHQVFELIIWLCGAIVSVSAAITIIVKVVQKIKAPEKSQNERITKLEKKAERFEQFFDNDNQRLKALEEGTIITQQSILALLSHAINGNDVNSLKDAKNDLEKYLTRRGVYKHTLLINDLDHKEDK